MREFALSDLSRRQGDLVDAALVAPISLTKHGKRKLVLLSVEAYESLVGSDALGSKSPAPKRKSLLAGLRKQVDDV